MPGLTLQQTQKMGFKPYNTGGMTLNQASSAGFSPLKNTMTSQPKPVGLSFSPGAAVNPTFQATGDENVLGAVGKLLGNMPSSAVNFAKGVFDFLNPVNTINKIGEVAQEIPKAAQDIPGNLVQKNLAVAAELPGAAYHVLVPQFLQSAFAGDFQGSLKRLTEDPVGQIAPMILIGKGIAEQLGVGDQFDAAMTKVASPVTAVAGKATDVAGAAGSQLLGLTTRKGASSFGEAYAAGQEGGAANQAFTETMRGKVSGPEVREQAQDALGNLIEQRNQTYQTNETASLKSFDANPENTLDVNIPKTAMIDGLNKLKVDTTGNPLVLDAPEGLKSIMDDVQRDRPDLPMADVKKVIQTVQNWDKNDAQGLNQLQKVLDGFRKGGRQGEMDMADSNFNYFVDSIKGSIKDELKTNVPGYTEMNQQYATDTAQIKEIRDALKLGDKTSVEAGTNKLLRLVRSDNAFAIDLAKQLEDAGAGDLVKKIAGLNLTEWAPSDIFRELGDIGIIASVITGAAPVVDLLGVLATSPKTMGEFVRALGVVSRYIGKTNVNIPTVAATGAIPAQVQSFTKSNTGGSRSNQKLPVQKQR